MREGFGFLVSVKYKVWTKFHHDSPALAKPCPAQIAKAPIHCRGQLASAHTHTASLVCLHSTARHFAPVSFTWSVPFPQKAFPARETAFPKHPLCGIQHIGYFAKLGQWHYTGKQIKMKKVCVESNCTRPFCALSKSAGSQKHTLQGHMGGTSYNIQRMLKIGSSAAAPSKS